MFLQDLLKKLVDFFKKAATLFSKENIEHLVLNSFKEIIIIISSVGLLILMIVILSVIGMRNKGSYSNGINVKKESQKNLSLKKDKPDEELLLNPSLFIIPNDKSMDLTNDFVPFLIKKQFQLLDKSVIINEDKKMLNDEVEDTLKFNFEKQSQSGKKIED